MTRFYGKVGYSTPGTLVDGVYKDTIVERAYHGKVLATVFSAEEAGKVNDDLRLRNQISLVADSFLLENFSLIKYVIWMGKRWKVESVDVQRPRLVLSFGGVYVGPIADPETTP